MHRDELVRIIVVAASQLCLVLGQQLQPIYDGTTAKSTARPNVIVILTDDQDVLLNSLDYMPYLKKHMTSQGATFTKHYCSTAICCPSRVTLWTGQLAHNTNVTDVKVPYGGFPKFVSQGYNNAYLPVWLNESGFNVYYTGKLFNAHSVDYFSDPYPAGFKHSYFLLDPYTYDYVNATFQHDTDPPVSYEGNYSTDTVASFGYKLLEDAVQENKPFFLTLAPIAPHSTVRSKTFSAPISALRHAQLFQNVTAPRPPNFNPPKPSGANWVKALDLLNQTVLDYNDHFYRQRLRALQALDELVDGLFSRLESHNLLGNTYVFFTSDNGFHIGQHRLHPGKTCGYEEDINVPFIVRGPGVAPGRTIEDVVAGHVDLAPTWFKLLGMPLRDDFDGRPFPITDEELDAAAAAGDKAGEGRGKVEHAMVEYWGQPLFEGDYGAGMNAVGDDIVFNTYKSLRLIGYDYSLYYSVWCNNEHELYDMTTDPYQMDNLLVSNTICIIKTILGYPILHLVSRLDTLLFVLKTCQATTCSRPWEALHPDGTVHTLRQALDQRHDALYGNWSLKVNFDECALGQIASAEGPVFHGLSTGLE